MATPRTDPLANDLRLAAVNDPNEATVTAYLADVGARIANLVDLYRRSGPADLAEHVAALDPAERAELFLGAIITLADVTA